MLWYLDSRKVANGPKPKVAPSPASTPKLFSDFAPGTSAFQLYKPPPAMMYSATKLIYRPLNRISPGIARHLFYNDYLNAIASFGWREQHTIVFDHLVAPTAFYISREEFADWWREVDASNVTISWHNSNSWRGFGRIPTKIVDDQANQPL